MIKIQKSDDGKFYATTEAQNGEPLNVTEMLERKQSVWKNLFAQAQNFTLKKHVHMLVQDVTPKTPQTWLVKSVGGNWIRTFLPAKTVIKKTEKQPVKSKKKAHGK